MEGTHIALLRRIFKSYSDTAGSQRSQLVTAGITGITPAGSHLGWAGSQGLHTSGGRDHRDHRDLGGITGIAHLGWAGSEGPQGLGRDHRDFSCHWAGSR